MSKPTVYAEMTTTDGKAVRWYVSERRRYGRCQFFTYVYYEVDGQENDDYFDPWPANQYPRSQLVWITRTKGLDVTPSAKDIRWAKKLFAEKRFFCMSQSDQKTYLEAA